MQQVVAGWFEQWGLPGEFRLDNGAPWGAAGRDFPPDLALWLVGWGIGLHWNRPRHKQGNAVIERAHGVCQRWVEPETWQSPAEVQARLDWATTTQREHYPACPGRQSRMAYYPALAAGGRPDEPTQAGAWDEHRVWTWLGTQVWPRRVDKVGRLSVAHCTLGVGNVWAGQEVTVRLVVQDGQPVWRIRDAQGHLIRQHPAPELSRERILALSVSSRRAHRQRAKASARSPA